MKVPLPTALTILGAAFVVSYLIATSAEPLTIKQYSVEPERNYTQETLRILNQPKVEYHRGPSVPSGAWAIGTSMFWSNGDREYATFSSQTRVNQYGNLCSGGACNR